ncbi:protein ovarian tumor locus-like isoform X2 [Bradysia coprophila]|uniref:protein ovarian tumor locus-like isoform X2 n=1 Tax=Bradysia coprophila TaxID=38358 RepID=UPI00187D9B3D|nr:protein ovarian tumor locus-like isoform X2 [Bradysia coprophila]
MKDRYFTTGSIEAPDPFDKHLDQIGFYRKHTARDATSLFRVISEQMYGAQIHHLDIRDFCVRYMAMYPSIYEKVVVGTTLTFEEYLAKLAKPRTFGTLTELTALAYRFKRNVFLLEGGTMGDWFVYEKEFEDTFLVFYAPPKHFDTVFQKSYIESVAFSQSLTYEILYSHVFKLPDVVYAVERMLHDPPEGTHISQIEVSPFDESQESLTLSDGRHFILDHADETECILKNYLFCHFHNKRFEKMVELEEFLLPQPAGDSWTFSDHIYASSLPRRNVSCVRQLLDENIKPFSYKVAKALDTHIYRNIEFDVWGDARRSARFKQWSQGDSLQVGVKCIIDNIDPNHKSSYCHIQEMRPQKNSCVVYVETLGDYRLVPISAIQTIPSVTWMVPTNPQHRYRTDKKRKRNSNNGRSNELCKLSYKCSKIEDDEAYLDIRYFTKPMHIPDQYHEYITQPQYASNRWSKNDENAGGNNQPNKNAPAKKSNQNPGGGEKSMKPDNNKTSTAKRPNPTADPKTTGKTGAELANVEFEPRVHYGNPTNMPYVERSNAAVVFSHMDNVEMDVGSMAQGYGGHGHFVPLQSMIKNKELLRSVYPPNLNAQPSVFPDGSDLRGVDYGTLRFFYNLGHEYMRYMHYRFPRKAVSAMFQGIINDAFPARQNRYSGGYYDNFQDMGELANDFSRSISFAGRDQQQQQHTNKPNEGQNQYRRMFNPNAVNAHKKTNNRNYRTDFNKGKRQFGDSDASKTNQQKAPDNYNQATTDYPDAVPTADPNVRTSEYDPSLPTMMPAPQPIYTDGGDPGMYGVPLVYGMYPQVNDNFASYPVPVPGGMMYAEPLNVDSDLTQTYPYYNPHGGFYYQSQMPPLQIGQHQGSWYPPSIVPIHSTMPMPIQASGSTVSAAPMPSTPTYGNYIVSEPELPSTPYTPNEQ